EHSAPGHRPESRAATIAPRWGVEGEGSGTRREGGVPRCPLTRVTREGAAEATPPTRRGDYGGLAVSGGVERGLPPLLLIRATAARTTATTSPASAKEAKAPQGEAGSAPAFGHPGFRGPEDVRRWPRALALLSIVRRIIPPRRSMTRV